MTPSFPRNGVSGLAGGGSLVRFLEDCEGCPGRSGVRNLGPFFAWLGVMVWVCGSCCGAVCFGPWEGDVEVGEDESLDGGEPIEDESAAACIGGVQVGEGG